MSRTMGFLISHKNSEKRRALLPKDMHSIQNVNCLYFESGYGESIGISDTEYLDAGANIVPREEAMACDILVDVKVGDADFIQELKSPKILYGWAHAVQGIEFTTAVLQGKHTVIAWEEMFEDGRHLFYRNQEIAGEAAVLQAFLHFGRMPYEARVAVLGSGQTARGAMRVLHGLGARVDVYDRKLEKLFLKRMFDYDVIVNCVLWDTTRRDRLIYRSDLKKFKKGTMIIDVSCNKQLEIETSVPTTIENPVYVVDGVIHYVVDNTPALFPVTVSNFISEVLAQTIDCLIDGNYSKTIRDAIVIQDGLIVDQKIACFRESRGMTLPNTQEVATTGSSVSFGS